MKSINSGLFFLFLALIAQSCNKEPEVVIQPKNGKSFLQFGFNTYSNSGLAQDIRAEIKNDTIYATTFAGTDLTALKPYFLTDAQEVRVQEKLQESEKTALDFSSSTNYVLKAADGSTKQYTVKFSDTRIPAVYITTNGLITSKTNYINGSLKIKANKTNDKLYEGKIEIRGRGNSTWNLAKKPYRIKLEKKAKLIGMNENKNWVLLANHSDKSLLRNDIGFELSRKIGLVYTPDSHFVEVILNGEYIGNYQLAEQVEEGKFKVNVEEQATTKTTFSDVSGGYLVEVDGFAFNEPINFITPQNMPLSVHYPDNGKINIEQRGFIKNHFAEFENRLFFKPFDDSLASYHQYFDLDSYVNYFIVNEIMGNSDMFWSTYMYKFRNDNTIFTGPVWDFDIAANNDFRIGNSVNTFMMDVAHNPKNWINKMIKDKVFRNKVRKRWNEVYESKLNNLGAYIDLQAAKLDASQKKNFLKWPILNEKIYLNFQTAGSYEEETKYLKNYLNNRVLWLNKEINGPRFD